MRDRYVGNDRPGGHCSEQKRSSPPVDQEAIARAAKLLGRAERPLIVIGAGALDASAEVQAIADMLEAPVSSFRRGRGAIPTTHRLAVSFTEGHRFWKDADAVLAIGTRLYWQQSNWGVDDRLPIVRVDIDPEEINRFRRPACALIGDAGACCGRCLPELPAHNRVRPRRDAALTETREWFDERLARLEPQMSFLRAIRAALPDDGIYVEDVTQIGFVSRLAFPVFAPRTYLSPGYQDTLGWSYGVALGAQAALRNARWLPWPAMAGSCTRPPNSRRRCATSCRWLWSCSMMARSGMFDGSSSSNMATG